MNSDVYFIHAITPLHAGVGQGVGVIDLPIARERATNMPYLPGSSLKGALRALSGESERTKPLFGPDTSHASDHAGSVQLSDARLLLFPVRSLRGVFAYATSPFLLNRFLRDARDAQVKGLDISTDGPATDERCLVVAKSPLLHGDRVWLEDLGLRADAKLIGQSFATLGQRIGIADLDKRICILSDDAMSFLVDTATEVVARIRLDQDKLTVARGGLWYEEALPAETVLTGIAHTRGNGQFDAKKALEEFRGLVKQHSSMQLGGKATVGRGVCRVSLAGSGQ